MNELKETQPKNANVKIWGATAAAALAGGVILNTSAGGLVALAATLASPPVTLTLGALGGGLLGWRWMQSRSHIPATSAPAVQEIAPESIVPVEERMVENANEVAEAATPAAIIADVEAIEIDEIEPDEVIASVIASDEFVTVELVADEIVADEIVSYESVDNSPINANPAEEQQVEAGLAEADSLDVHVGESSLAQTNQVETDSALSAMSEHATSPLPPIP